MTKTMIRTPPKPTPKRRHQRTKCDVCGGLPCWTHCNCATFVLDVLGHLDRYSWAGGARKRTLERFLELGARLAELRETLELLRDMAEREVGCWPYDELFIYDGLGESNATSTPQAVAPALALAQKDEDPIKVVQSSLLSRLTTSLRRWF